MEPYPAGTVVLYKWDRWVITDHQDPREVFTVGEAEDFAKAGMPTLEESYPDGVAYILWREGAMRKFGNRDGNEVTRVRRGSLTLPVEKTE